MFLFCSVEKLQDKQCDKGRSPGRILWPASSSIVTTGGRAVSALHFTGQIDQYNQLLINQSLTTDNYQVNEVGDGDGFTAYVDTADLREAADVPREVHEALSARAQSRGYQNYQRIDALRSSAIEEAEYKYAIKLNHSPYSISYVCPHRLLQHKS